MSALFWFALIVGGGLLLVSTLGHVLGDVFGDADGSVETGDGGGMEVHAEAEAGVDAGPDGAGAEGAPVDHYADQSALRFLSLRTATYFLFGFGAAGVLLNVLWHGDRAVVTSVVALVAGLAAAWISAALFGWVKRSESGALAGDHALVGATGVVTLPLARESTGKVLVRTAGRELELLARPLQETEADPGAWTDVMVVDVVDGVAVVTPYETQAT